MDQKAAFLFPGQGSQRVGMGQDFYNNFEQAREIFHKADEILGEKISDLCFNGPEEELKKTYNAQPAILTVSLAVMKVLNSFQIYPRAVAGHSLGEISALVGAGVLSFEQAVRMVRVRGELMDRAVPDNQGSMAAVMGLSREKIEDTCDYLGDSVQVANYNSPKQTVISGEKKGVREGQRLLKEAGAQKVIPLRVSGPFHSQLMAEAAEEFARYLEEVEFSKPRCIFYSNVTGEKVAEAAEIKKLLIKQICSPVYWQEIMENMSEEGFDPVMIMGEGKALVSFLRGINRRKKPCLFSDVDSLYRILGSISPEEISVK